MKQANSNEMLVATGALLIFVYGTLKHGQSNHDRFCRTALCIEEAAVRGRLYELPSGIPALRVPDNDIIAVGTADPLADAAMHYHSLERISTEVDHDAGEWQMIRGELMVFAEPRLSLPPIDRLEGFRPGMSSLYRRVLVPVLLDGGQRVPVWCYVAGEHLDLRALPSGNTSWPE